jgi:hypothetical protein
MQQAMLRDGGISSGVRQIGGGEHSKESFLGGTLTLTAVETHGLVIDLPEIFRRLRTFLKGGTEK